jgi:hypothetical protein
MITEPHIYSHQKVTQSEQVRPGREFQIYSPPSVANPVKPSGNYIYHLF